MGEQSGLESPGSGNRTGKVRKCILGGSEAPGVGILVVGFLRAGLGLLEARLGPEAELSYHQTGIHRW